MAEANSLVGAIRERAVQEVVERVQQEPDLLRERDERGITPLLAAVEEDLSDVALFLLERGADIREMDNDGYTVLHLVRSLKLAEELIARGADVNIANNYRRTPLHIAVIDDHKDIVELLLQSGADIHAEDNKKFTPLRMAIEYKLPDIEAILLHHGA